MTKAAPKRSNSLIVLLVGVGVLVLAYVLGSTAIDSGSYWHYMFFAVLLLLGIKLLVQAVKKACQAQT